VGVEHIQPRVFVSKLQDASLRLGLHNIVRVFTRCEAGPGRVIIEEIRVQVKTVDQIEFKDVHQENTDFLANADLDRMELVVEGDSVDGIEIILIVNPTN